MTLLPGVLVVLVAGCHAQDILYPANTYALPQQPQLHHIPVVPYYQPQPQLYTATVETSGIKNTQTIQNSPSLQFRSFSIKRIELPLLLNTLESVYMLHSLKRLKVESTQMF